MEIVVASAAQISASAARPAEPRSIFVLRNNDVGDVLLVTPLLAALRKRFPSARIAAGVGPWSAAALERNPHVNAVLSVSAPWANNYAKGSSLATRVAYLLRSPELDVVRRSAFAVGIDVVGTSWGSLFLMRAGIPWRLGVEGYAGGHSGTQAGLRFDPQEHVARFALGFAELLGATDLPAPRPQIFLDADERAAGERRWSEARDGGARVVVGPGSGLELKGWPLPRYEALIASLALDEGVNLAVVTGPKERGLALSAGAARVLPGLGLREVFALVASADLVVCNSSMLLHVAAAFDKPAVVLLGPAFASARQHQAQWGYPGLSLTLGPEAGAAQVATADAALVAIRERLAGIPTAAHPR
jgi:heptosyltransferase-2